MGSDLAPGGDQPVVEIAAFATAGEAEVAVAKLRSFGIAASIDDDVAGGTLPMDGERGVVVQVAGPDERDARLVLEEVPPDA